MIPGGLLGVGLLGYGLARDRSWAKWIGGGLVAWGVVTWWRGQSPPAPMIGPPSSQVSTGAQSIPLPAGGVSAAFAPGGIADRLRSKMLMNGIGIR